MRLNCTIDNVAYTMNVNADKPLNMILEENLESFSSNNKCLGASCGNCIVMINGVCTLSCLMPAFKLSNANIQTYESFSKTRYFRDIEKAYKETGVHPCRTCFASKTLLIESILQKLEEQKQDAKSGNGGKKISSVINSDFLARELSVNSCKCLDASQLTRVIILANQYRSKRRGKA